MNVLQAKQVLKEAGFMTGLLWHTSSIETILNDEYENQTYSGKDIKVIAAICEKNNNDEYGFNYDNIRNAIDQHFKL